MFGLYGNTAGTPVPVSSCPLDGGGALLPGTQSIGNLFDGYGCANQRQESLQNSDHETVFVVKIDNTINSNNTVWYRFQSDTGLQAAYTDPINAIFNSYSPQPQYTLVAGYTHIFRTNLVNQFNPGASWYSSIFEPNNFASVQETFPIVLTAGSNNAPLTTIGGNDNTYPQGRKVTQWQINDNLDWTRGKQDFRFGVNTRRIDVSDYDLGEGSVPAAVYNDLAEFTYGAAYTESWTFPVSSNERIAAGNLDLYAMDTYKPDSRTTFTAGLRATWNTDPVNRQRLFARPLGSFLDMSHNANQPLNQVIQTGERNLFLSTPLFVWQPRVSVAYQLTPAMVVHLGFGVFNDIIPPRSPISPPPTLRMQPPSLVVSAARWAALPSRPACQTAPPMQPRAPTGSSSRFSAPVGRPAPESRPALQPALSPSVSIPSPPARSRRRTTTSTISALSRSSTRTVQSASAMSARADSMNRFR